MQARGEQFEEFFFVYTELAKRKQFFEFLSACLNIPFVKVILSVREDYLHYLLACNRQQNLGVINQDILSKHILYYLGNFSRADAKNVIQSLTTRTHFHLEAALIEHLVEELAADLGELRPIELQLVGAQLQTEKITTLEEYRQKGTIEQLVARYLEAVIQDYGSENERAARSVLYLFSVKERNQFQGHSQGVNSVVFSPNGQIIASASNDSTVKIWSRQGKKIQTIKGYKQRVNSVVFSPDGKTIATASSDNNVKL